MPLTPGSRIGAYEITATLGAGGMGAVYRARDTRLGRAVALKVILETFASDAERIARFEREAKMLAALNHPRIAGLYGMEQADGQHFLVMELVEGETLAERLRRGPMSVEEALALGLQIAEALEAAHEKGVIHRDLKPANVKITPEQQIKVLDFGLAKAIENEASSADMANSPTLSMMATQAGVILGTAAYMSPEQAKGFPADHRSDVFSFGTVLFEMLTGRQPFQGDTAPEILASVLVREPEIQHLPSDANPRLIELVKRCLEKSPKRRWQHVGDVRAELESLAASPRSTVMAPVQAPPAPFWKRALVPAAVTIVAAALTGAAVWNIRPEPSAAVVRMQARLPDGQTWAYTGRRLVDISRDGSRLAYVAGNKLYVRDLAEFEGAPVAGAAGIDVVTGPVFSPDGRFVAIYSTSDQMLKKVPVGGGAATNICKTGNPMGVHWTADGWLYFASTQEGVRRVSENGGNPETLIPPDPSARFFGAFPAGDGETLIVAIAQGSASDRWDAGEIAAHNVKTGARKTLVTGGSDPRLLPGGFLAYAHAGIVYAVPFDERRLEVTGPAVPILEGVRRAPGNTSGAAQYAFSDSGTVAYLPGAVAPESIEDTLAVSDVTGAAELLKLTSGGFRAPRASPDGRRIVFERREGTESIFIYDLDGTTAARRLTFDGRAAGPIFSADGQHVTFHKESDNQSERGLYWIRADGSGGLERLTTPAGGEIHVAEDWAPDGRTLLFSAGGAGRWTLWALSMPERRATQISTARGVAPLGASFSPDGRWIAYAVPGGTLHTIYVEPFPGTGAKFEAPRRAGDDPHHPLWSPDGKALYATVRPGVVEMIPVAVAGRTFTFGNPSPVANGYRTQAPTLPRNHDILPNGRFVGLSRDAAQSGGASVSTEIHFVVNWFAELKGKLRK